MQPNPPIQPTRLEGPNEKQSQRAKEPKPGGVCNPETLVLCEVVGIRDSAKHFGWDNKSRPALLFKLAKSHLRFPSAFRYVPSVCRVGQVACE